MAKCNVSLQLQWILLLLIQITPVLLEKTEHVSLSCYLADRHSCLGNGNESGEITSDTSYASNNSVPKYGLIALAFDYEVTHKDMNIAKLLSVNHDSQTALIFHNVSHNPSDDAFYLSLKVSEEDLFTSQLENSSSVEYKRLAKQVEGAVDSIYTKSSSYVRAKVLKFRKGSVIADVKLEFSSNQGQVYSAEEKDVVRRRANRRIRSTEGNSCNGSVCHVNATCVNNTGSGLSCKCNTGFIGNGLNCTGNSNQSSFKSQVEPTSSPILSVISSYVGEGTSSDISQLISSTSEAIPSVVTGFISVTLSQPTSSKSNMPSIQSPAGSSQSITNPTTNGISSTIILSSTKLFSANMVSTMEIQPSRTISFNEHNTASSGLTVAKAPSHSSSFFEGPSLNVFASSVSKSVTTPSKINYSTSSIISQVTIAAMHPTSATPSIGPTSMNVNMNSTVHSFFDLSASSQLIFESQITMTSTNVDVNGVSSMVSVFGNNSTQIQPNFIKSSSFGTISNAMNGPFSTSVPQINQSSYASLNSSTHSTYSSTLPTPPSIGMSHSHVYSTNMSSSNISIKRTIIQLYTSTETSKLVQSSHQTAVNEANSLLSNVSKVHSYSEPSIASPLYTSIPLIYPITTTTVKSLNSSTSTADYSHIHLLSPSTTIQSTENISLIYTIPTYSVTVGGLSTYHISTYPISSLPIPSNASVQATTIFSSLHDPSSIANESVNNSSLMSSKTLSSSSSNISSISAETTNDASTSKISFSTISSIMSSMYNTSYEPLSSSVFHSVYHTLSNQSQIFNFSSNPTITASTYYSNVLTLHPTPSSLISNFYHSSTFNRDTTALLTSAFPSSYLHHSLYSSNISTIHLVQTSGTLNFNYSLNSTNVSIVHVTPPASSSVTNSTAHLAPTSVISNFVHSSIFTNISTAYLKPTFTNTNFHHSLNSTGSSTVHRMLPSVIPNFNYSSNSTKITTRSLKSRFTTTNFSHTLSSKNMSSIHVPRVSVVPSSYYSFSSTNISAVHITPSSVATRYNNLFSSIDTTMVNFTTTSTIFTSNSTVHPARTSLIRYSNLSSNSLKSSVANLTPTSVIPSSPNSTNIPTNFLKPTPSISYVIPNSTSIINPLVFTVSITPSANQSKYLLSTSVSVTLSLTSVQSRYQLLPTSSSTYTSNASNNMTFSYSSYHTHSKLSQPTIPLTEMTTLPETTYKPSTVVNTTIQASINITQPTNSSMAPVVTTFLKFTSSSSNTSLKMTSVSAGKVSIDSTSADIMMGISSSSTGSPTNNSSVSVGVIRSTISAHSPAMSSTSPTATANTTHIPQQKPSFVSYFTSFSTDIKIVNRTVQSVNTVYRSSIFPSVTAYSGASSSVQTTVKTSSGMGVRLISFNVTIKNRQYSSQLSNASSHEYAELKEEVISSLTPVYERVPRFVRIDVLGFRNGSVIVEFDVVMNSTSNTTKTKLEDILKAANGTNKNRLVFTAITSKERCTSGYCMDHGQCSETKTELKCSCSPGYSGKRCSIYTAGSSGDDDDDDFEEYWIAIGVCLGLLVLIIILLIILAMRRRRKYYVTRESVMSVGKTSGDVFFNPAYGDSNEFLANSNNSNVIPLEVVYENSSFKYGNYAESEFIENKPKKKKQDEEDEEEDIYKTQLLLFLKQNNLLKGSDGNDTNVQGQTSRRSSSSMDSDLEDR